MSLKSVGINNINNDNLKNDFLGLQNNTDAGEEVVIFDDDEFIEIKQSKKEKKFNKIN